MIEFIEEFEEKFLIYFVKYRFGSKCLDASHPEHRLQANQKLLFHQVFWMQHIEDVIIIDLKRKNESEFSPRYKVDCPSFEEFGNSKQHGNL